MGLATLEVDRVVLLEKEKVRRQMGRSRGQFMFQLDKSARECKLWVALFLSGHPRKIFIA